MAKLDDSPLKRGEYETGSGTYDHLLGREYEFEDVDWSASPTSGNRTKATRSGKMVRVRLVKNSTGAAILPKRIVAFSSTAGEFNAVAKGYTRLTAARGFPADEFLPAAGVPDGAYFYVVVRGPAMVLTPLAGADMNGDITVGQMLVALTAATSGATTAGRVAVQNITGSSQATDYTFLFDQVQNAIGRALSAATTGNTNTGILLDVGKW